MHPFHRPLDAHSAAAAEPHHSSDRRNTLRGLLGLTLGGALPALSLAQNADEPSALEKIRARGALVVAIYDDMRPFHLKGQGIDVQIAQALARELGVRLSLLPFTADENMNDDLRNMVWKGHYLGFGPADVMLHVPVDPPLMKENPRVTIFGPYWREKVMIARDLKKVPELDSLEVLKGQRVAVPGQSLAGWLMIGADNGAYRETLVTKLGDGVDAAQMLKNGEVVAAAGLRSELEATLHGDSRFAITPLPMPRAPHDGWVVGMAVKRSATDLSQALQTSLDKLAAAGELRKIFGTAGLDWQKT
ncbi:MAG: substrate-binding periplasmic protein [Leptothrix sp. (in: b-proteobacteria)]